VRDESVLVLVHVLQVWRRFGGRLQAGTVMQHDSESGARSVEAYKKEGSKFMQRLVAKQKLRTKQTIHPAKLANLGLSAYTQPRAKPIGSGLIRPETL